MTSEDSQRVASLEKELSVRKKELEDAAAGLETSKAELEEAKAALADERDSHTADAERFIEDKEQLEKSLAAFAADRQSHDITIAKSQSALEAAWTDVEALKKELEKSTSLDGMRAIVSEKEISLESREFGAPDPVQPAHGDGIRGRRSAEECRGPRIISAGAFGTDERQRFRGP